MTEELYGRSGAERTAEALGYAPCRSCGQRTFHSLDCPVRRASKSPLPMVVGDEDAAADPRPVMVVAPQLVERMKEVARPAINVVAAERIPTK